MDRIKTLSVAAVMTLALAGCDDEIDWGTGGDTPVSSDFAGMYILCEGLFNMTNSMLTY